MPPPKPIMLARPAIGPRLRAAHRLHHVGHGAMHFEEPVDVLGLGAGAGGDALLAARLEQIGIAPLPRRHRVDDRDLALEHASRRDWRSAIWFFILAMPGSMPIRPPMPPMLLHLRELLAQVGEIERALAHLLGDARRLLGVDRRGGLLDQRDDVAHAEDAVGDARGMKSSSASSFSPVPISLIGLPVTARIDSAAPPRPSPSTRVSTMPVSPTRSSNARARLTASWPVSASATSSTSCGLAARSHLGRLAHHRFVERGAAGGVEHHHVVAAEAAGLERARRDLHRRLAGDDRQRVDARPARPSTASCSIAAGRRVSSEAISTLRC